VFETWALDGSLRRVRARSQDGRAGDAAFAVALARLFGPTPREWPAVARSLRPAARSRRVPPTVALAGGAVAVAADLPGRLRRADQRWLPVVVANGGAVPVASAAPYPLHLAVRWTRAGTGRDGREPDRVVLPGPIAPGARRTVPFRIVAPWEPGTWELRIAAVQEGVAWFDEAAAVREVEVIR
jgi:hypothetical protein